MRVIAGCARSLRLEYPAGTRIRPTTDAMREMLFSTLGEQVLGARFADLYAGAGSVGIEALSRGAAHCVFIEKDPRCVGALERNLEHVGLRERATVVRGSVERRWAMVCGTHGPFDLVFADPPYDRPECMAFVQQLTQGWEGVAPQGLVVVQSHVDVSLVLCGGRRQVKRIGDTQFIFCRREVPADRAESKEGTA